MTSVGVMNVTVCYTVNTIADRIINSVYINGIPCDAVYDEIDNLIIVHPPSLSYLPKLTIHHNDWLTINDKFQEILQFKPL